MRPALDLLAWAGFVAGLGGLLGLHLLPSLLAGLLVYVAVDALVPAARVASEGGRPRRLAVTLIALLAVVLMGLAAIGVVWLVRHGAESLPALMQRMAEIVEHSRERLPAWVQNYVPDDADAVRDAVVAWLRSHVDVFQIAGAELLRALAHMLVGMVIGALLSLERARSGRGPLAAAIAAHAARLASAFRRVVFAQVWISALNTLFTAVYLLVALPALGIDLPFAKTLVVITFVAGLVPILGNLISNTIVFIVSLSQSFGVALASLAYLVAIHKLEYFLNARIVGSHIRARAWELLLAMLCMEAAFGLAGLVAAPVYYAWLKDEFAARGLI
ncbi:MAG: AI-2E family transporter [Gammaproteobacteria bacterium]|nr:AI-2E family transporter [Gammaproteobacteria bacterium]MCP5198726.1 AI-2E family transporter [Gammaproteobacteria bacterium]